MLLQGFLLFRPTWVESSASLEAIATSASSRPRGCRRTFAERAVYAPDRPVDHPPRTAFDACTHQNAVSTLRARLPVDLCLRDQSRRTRTACTIHRRSFGLAGRGWIAG